MTYVPQFCLQCGHPLEHKQVLPNEPKRYVCAACGRIHYQNPLPTSGALVVEAGKLLLVRRGVDPYKGAWDIPGGFLEKDEHPEPALVREMREELGVDIAIGPLVGVFMGHYYDTNVSTLNFYYETSIIAGTPTPQSDIDAVAWFPLADVPDMPFPQNNEAVRAYQSSHH